MTSLSFLKGAPVCLGVLAVGVTAASHPSWAVALAVVVLLGAVSVRAPAGVLVAVLPAAYISWRVGPGGSGLSVADAALFMGTLASVPFVPWAEPRLRRVLLGLAVYEGTLALAVVSHPTQRAILEWGHRILLVGGSLMVGTALLRLVTLRGVLKTYLGASVAVAIASVLYTLTDSLRPAYPFGFNKNAAGLLLAFALVITVVAPTLATFATGLLGPLRVALVLGLLSTQSRGAMLAIVVAVVVPELRRTDSRRGIPLVIVTSAILLAGVLLVTQREAEKTRLNPDGAQYYGIGARSGSDHEALDIWGRERLLGAGLRYFYDPMFRTSEPHNVVIVSLAETGIIGVAGLCWLLWSGWSALRGLDGQLATLARAVLAVQVLAGMFDIFWVAGRGSFAWALIGGAVGARAIRPDGDELPMRTTAVDGE